jgi:hypothetical protein
MCVSRDLPSWQELEEMFEADFENGRLWNRKTGKELTGRNGVGYVCAKVNGKVCYRHRILVKMYLKDAMQEDLVVHHLNEIKGDDRISNLLSVTHQQNLEATSLAITGKCGVWYRTESHRWTAVVSKGARVVLGTFALEGMAVTARNAAMEFLNSGGKLTDCYAFAREAVVNAYGEDCFNDVKELAELYKINYGPIPKPKLRKRAGRPSRAEQIESNACWRR